MEFSIEIPRMPHDVTLSIPQYTKEEVTQASTQDKSSRQSRKRKHTNPTDEEHDDDDAMNGRDENKDDPDWQPDSGSKKVGKAM